MIASRRRFLFGASATLLAAPAIVRVASLMVIKPLPTLKVFTVSAVGHSSTELLWTTGDWT
jgi:hypothetical protein